MSLPRPSAGVAWAPFGGDLVLYDPVAERVHVCNPSGRVVWEACAAGADRVDLVAAIVDASGADPTEVDDGVRAHLGDLVTEGLLGVQGWEGFERPEPVAVARRHRSRLHRVIDDTVAFWSDDPALLTEVDTLLGATSATSATSGDDSEVTEGFAVDVHTDAGVRVSGRGVDVWWPSTSAALEAVPSLLNGVAAVSSSCLALHAGAVVAPGGEVVVLPAVSGSGKSTLTAALVADGWGYVTDEAVGIRAGSLAAVAYAKPLSLDATSRAAVGLGDLGSDNVTVDALGGGVVRPDPGPVTRVVLPRFVAGAAVTVTDLDPDAAFMAVAEHALNLRHVGGDGLVALAEVARGVPCHGLVHGGGPEVVEALRALTEGGNRPI